MTETADYNLNHDFIMYSASQLIEQIALTGPGGVIEVRSHHLPTGKSKEGLAQWSSDLVGGSPAVLYHDKLDNPEWVTGALPLGGRTHFLPGFTHTDAVNPSAEANYGFEILAQ